MRVTVHCPMLYRQAATDKDLRDLIWDLLTLTYQNPWVLPYDIIPSLLEEVTAWDDTRDRQRFGEGLKQLASRDGNQALQFPSLSSSDAVARAHQIARVAEYHWLVDTPPDTHAAPTASQSTTPPLVSPQALVMVGKSNQDRTLPYIDHPCTSPEEFERWVWTPLFKTTKWVAIYDRNIARYWKSGDGYPYNLQWILRRFGEDQPHGHVSIHTEPTSPRILSEIRSACQEWGKANHLDCVDVRDDVPRSFHDRYLRTQQGWWQSHRGIDLANPRQNGRLRGDVALHWMAQQGPRLNTARS
jgi:hypothetical protein